jgi:hypothetical protein
MESQRNPQEEMLDNQTANKTNKHIKKRKKIPSSGAVEFLS